MNTPAGPRRRARLDEACLYLVVTVDRDDARAFEATTIAVAGGGVDMVQLRDVSHDAGRRRSRARRLQALCATHDVLFLLNDDPELAAAIDADGAHVGQGDVPAEAARAWLGPDRLLGLSTHDTREIEVAGTAPVDYVGLGPCFPTGSKKLERAPGGAALVARCLAAAGPLPVFPIGGIDPSNVGRLADAGATRAAVGAGILADDDPLAAADAIRQALRPQAS